MTGRVQFRQLYSLSPLGSTFPNYVDHAGRLHTCSSDHLPIMTWPDGSWCSQANTHMRELLEKGLSRRNRGGTLSVAAAHISHLLRFCWKRRVDPIDLTDNQFREFINELKDAVRQDDPARKMREANSVIAIGRSCLAFLESVGRHADDPGFLGPTGRVRVSLREHVGAAGGRGTPRYGKGKIVHYYDHPAFPSPAPKRKRLPIATASIEEMRKAVAKTSTTPHVRARRHTVLKLLEVTGARRGEIALLSVESLHQASLMEQPMLRMPTLKKKGGEPRHRYLPISRADLAFLLQYAEVHRRSVIRRRLRGRQDHGFLLVSQATGMPLHAGTITQEVRSIAKAADICGPACPHMFRHRFLTKLFVALVERHELENPDQFRRLLLSSEDLKRKVAEWTDHSDLSSLDRYINLAFDEVGSYRHVYDLTRVSLALDSFVGVLDAEIGAISSREQPLLIVERLKTYVEKLKHDISDSRSLTRGSTTA